MKLQVASDIHREMERAPEFWGHINECATQVDALVLAGDAFNWSKRAREDSLVDLGLLSEKYRQVFYVPGNHEYYGCWPRDVADQLDQVERDFPNVRVIRSGEVTEFMGHRILGGTGWFRDTRTHYRITDHSAIRGFLPWAYGEHDAFLRGLQANLRPGDVVVSHHAPGQLSVAAEYASNPCNCFFIMDDLDQLIAERSPALWIHGHTHTAFDYRVGPTRVVCNPLAYRWELDKRAQFKMPLIVEL